VIQRGNKKQICFVNEQDFADYAQWLSDYSKKHEVDIHAWVFMTNHVHLLVTPSDKYGVSRMMQALGRNYVKYINLTYKRTGTLWEGRFKSSLVGSDSYFLNVSKYIELNPVRAKMVDLPGEYPWSSYRHNAMGVEIGLIKVHELYKKLGTSKMSRLLAYRGFFENGFDVSLLDEIRLSINKEWALGESKFTNEVEAMLERKVTDIKWGGDRKSKSYHSRSRPP